MFLGSPGYDKSSVLADLLVKWYSGYFHKIYLFTDTNNVNGEQPWGLAQQSLSGQLEYCGPFDENQYLDIIQERNLKSPRALVIFDDIDEGFRSLEPNQLNYAGAQVNLSIAITSSTMSYIDRRVAHNLTDLVVLRLHDWQSKDAVFELLDLSPEEFSKMYEFATENDKDSDHNFLHVDCRHYYFFKNWNTSIVLKDRISKVDKNL